MQNSGHRGHHGHGHPQQSLLVGLTLIVTLMATTSPGLTAHALSNTALAAEKEHRATWCC